MDLIAIAQTIRRHKFAALPVIILTFALAVYVIVVSKADYEAVGTYALVNPPPAPSAAQIAQDPSLGKVNANNPLVSYGNLSVVGVMLTQAMGTQATQRTLLADGIDPRSTVTEDSTTVAPIITVSGMGATAPEAVNSGIRLGDAVRQELNGIQARLGVSQRYRIGVYPLGVPNQASLKVSSKLRDLAGVLALGVILLWVSISVAVARVERKKARLSSGPTPEPAAWQGPHSVVPVTARREFGVDGTGNVSDARRSVPGARLLSRDRK